MWQTLVGALLTGLSAWGFAHRVASFIEDQCLAEHQRSALRERFECWWFKAQEMDERTFAMALVSVMKRLFEGFFGPQLFSRTALMRSMLLGTGLLAASITGMSLVGSQCMPWQHFEQSAAMIESASLRNASLEKEGQSSKEIQNLADTVKHFKTTNWKLAYSIFFVVALCFSNGLAFFASQILSRMVLNEVVISGRSIPILAILALNLQALIVGALLYAAFVGILTQPFLWSIASILLTLPPDWFLGANMFVGASVWMLADADLIAISSVPLIPFLFTVTVCLMSLLAVSHREAFRESASWFLLRCTDKKPISFVVSFLSLGTLFVVLVYLFVRSC